MDNIEKWLILSMLIPSASFLAVAIWITAVYYDIIWSGYHTPKYTNIEMLHIWLEGSGTYSYYAMGIFLMILTVAIFIMFKKYNKGENDITVS